MERKQENYTDIFEKCAQWLESNRLIRVCVQWLQKNVKLALVSVFVMVCLVYLWIAYYYKAFIFQNTAADQMAMHIHDLKERVDNLEKHIDALETHLSAKEREIQQKNNNLYMQLDALKQVASLGKIPLSEMELNGREVSLRSSKTFWVRERNLRLSGLRFGEGWDQPLRATHNIHCTCSINQGPQLEISGSGDTLAIPLPLSEETKFTLLLSKVVFYTELQENYTGFACFIVNVDAWKPEIRAELEGNAVRLTLTDRGSEATSDNLVLKAETDAGKSWIATPATPGPFEWRRGDGQHHLKLPMEEVGKWQKLRFSVEDLAGNISIVALRNLPRPEIAQVAGTYLMPPVMLTIISEAGGGDAFFYMERFENGEFRFLYKTRAGPLSLEEGHYRAKAFFVIEGEQGPYSNAVEFWVDKTPPEAQVNLYEQQRRLHWQIIPGEEGVRVCTSILWQDKFLALNAVGESGYCELPPDARELTVQIKLKDRAGNENVLIRNWTCGERR